MEESDVRRDIQIVRTSMVGIAGNAVLAGFKAIVGMLTGSIAIVLDAVNNLSDALSSIITIVGTRYAARPADHHHPYGHGRAEYLTALIIATFVLAAGLMSLHESAQVILHPKVPSYDPLSLALLVLAIAVKIALGRYYKMVGRRISSASLVASGADATMDAIISTATVVAAVLYVTMGLSVEAWLAAVISLVIIKSGIDMLRETLSKVLGERVDSDLARAVKQAAESVEGVRGAYDLFLHDYGPDRMQGSIHVEVDDTMTAAQIDALTKRVTERVKRECQVALVAVGIYAANTSSTKAEAMRSHVEQIVWQHRYVREMHGFYVDEPHHTVRFDVVVGFDDPDRQATYDAIMKECEEAYPDYRFSVLLDSDVSD